MQVGTKVQIKWDSDITGHKDIALIYPLGDTVCEVVYYDGVGINHVLLPEGVTLPGFSKPWGDKEHFIVLHQNHIKPATNDQVTAARRSEIAQMNALQEHRRAINGKS